MGKVQENVFSSKMWLRAKESQFGEQNGNTNPLVIILLAIIAAVGIFFAYQYCAKNGMISGIEASPTAKVAENTMTRQEKIVREMPFKNISGLFLYSENGIAMTMNKYAELQRNSLPCQGGFTINSSILPPGYIAYIMNDETIRNRFSFVNYYHDANKNLLGTVIGNKGVTNVQYTEYTFNIDGIKYYLWEPKANLVAGQYYGITFKGAGCFLNGPDEIFSPSIMIR